MKKLLNLLLILFSSIIIILGLAFIFLEARLLISLDWSIYDFAFNGFIRYLFRFIISLFALSNFIIEIIVVFKKIDILKSLLRASNISLSIFLFMFAILNANFEGILLLFIFLLLQAFKLIKSGLVIIPNYIAYKKNKASQIEEINIQTDEQN